MATAAIMATGVKLQIGNGATPTEVFDDLAELRTLRAGGIQRDLRDVTNHGSTGGWREFILGLKDGAEITGTCNYVPTDGTHNASTGILADLVSGARRNMKIIWPDSGNTTWTFQGIVRSFEPTANADSELTFDFSIKMVGQPTLA